MDDQTALLLELHHQLMTDDVHTSAKTVREALGWDEARTSQLLERLELRE